MVRSSAGLLVLVALLAAGCAAPAAQPAAVTAPPVADAGWAKKAIAFGEGHDHREWTHHVGLTTPNFEVLGWDPLEFQAHGGAAAGGNSCGGAATTPDGRRITVANTIDSQVSFSVVDSTDPTKPVHLGDFVLENVQTYDVDITADGRYAIVAADLPFWKLDRDDAAALEIGAPTLVRSSFRDACTGEVRSGPESAAYAGPSTLLVSLEDPSNPTLVDAFPAPVIGPHSVSTATIDDVTYVASSTTNLVHAISYYQFFEVLDTPAGGRLLHLSTVDAGTHGRVPVLENGHVEAEIAKHPVTEKLVAYLSNLDGGLVVMDLSNPRAPLEIGAWADTQADAGSMHGTFSLPYAHEGRHYVLAGQELLGRPSDRPSGWVYILDDTDPSNIVEMGRGTLPVDSDPEWGESIRRVELFSTHYFRVVGDVVFVSMYHGGVWAFRLDLSDPEALREPASLGAFVPDRYPETGRVPEGVYDYAPFIMDSFAFEDGTLVVYDNLSGVYTVRFHPEIELATPKPWPASGQEHED